uniref:Uncharacterized protein MANES_11G078200 n=1 Tax=Rhizophora mucronata TaxID=61149 RepID=A0A2P2KZX3_RHIMU
MFPSQSILSEIFRVPSNSLPMYSLDSNKQMGMVILYTIITASFIYSQSELVHSSSRFLFIYEWLHLRGRSSNSKPVPVPAPHTLCFETAPTSIYDFCCCLYE